MERLQTLIDKLQEQVKLKGNVAQMQLLVQMLQLELRKLQKKDFNSAADAFPSETKQVDQIESFSRDLKEVNTNFLQEESLNDKLKEDKTELLQALKNGAVQDLRKAIDINSKFVFIKELFGNDEVLYEKSVKKINEFSQMAEAEFWIQQELKSKLNWDDSTPTIHQFYELVRRRFS